MEEYCLHIPLSEIEPGLALSIYPEGNSVFRVIDPLDASEFSESEYQIIEGNSYEYHFSRAGFQLKASIPGIAIPSKRHASSGRVVPNIYVGTLTFDIVDSET